MMWFKKKNRYTDKEIIKIIQEGDQKKTTLLNKYLFEDLFFPLLHAKQARNILNDLEYRVDAYNHAFTQFFITIKEKQFRGESTLSTFFMNIFLSRCKDKVRSLNSEKYKANKPMSLSVEEALKNLSDSSQDILKNLIHKTDLEFIFQQLRNLSETCFQVISLKIQGYSYQEIAVSLGKTANSVKTTNYQCMQKLINKLKVVKM